MFCSSLDKNCNNLSLRPSSFMRPTCRCIIRPRWLPLKPTQRLQLKTLKVELTLHMQCILHEDTYTTSMAQPGIVLSPHAVKHLIWHPDHAMHSNLSQQAQDFVHRVIKTLEIHWVHIAIYCHQTLEMHFPQISCSMTFAQACSNILSMLRCFELLHTHNSLIISTSCM